MSWPEDGNEGQPQSSTSNSEEELFVFGYSCKVFRDDEKAKWVEKEKHLIPWMGGTESGLLIDRYDVRGALMDLKPYEAPIGGANYLQGLTPEELLVEKLCDEERYREFDEDSEYDENLYQDKDIDDQDLGIRTEQTSTKEFGSVGYIYNDTPATASIGPEPKKLQDELPYVQPVELDIPANILLPTTMKSHAIIEKTAKFIASQGTQMEIILKTKQSKNPLFDFLSHGDSLNPYYKFIVDAIKSNVYKPPDEIPYPEDSPTNGKGGEDGNSSDGSDDGYLHPSLVNNTASDITKFLIPQGSFKPSINCAYSLLVSKIKEVESELFPPSTTTDASNNNNPPESVPVNPPPAVNPPTSGFNSYPDYSAPPVVNTMPAPEEQLIIDKMANYVVKNGPDFETMARTKGDPRFAFLDKLHEHFWFYVQCKERCLVEAQAVVASKGFVRYRGDNNSSFAEGTTTTSTKVTAPEKSSVFQPPPSSSTVKSIPEEPPRKNNAVTAPTRVRVKESPPMKIKPEKLIKLPSSLPNFVSVLKQAGSAEDKNGEHKNNNKLSSESKDEEEVRKLKEERRKKAALFLQRLKKLEPVQSQSSLSTAIEVATSDVESIPSPSTALRTEPFGESSNTQQEHKESLPEKRKAKNDDRPEIILEKIAKESSSSRDKAKDKHKVHDDDYHRGSRGRSRSRHRRSRSSSYSDSPRSSSSSRSPKRKKSKSKHSKKRHKKRDRSRSKKSKKHRH